MMDILYIFLIAVALSISIVNMITQFNDADYWIDNRCDIRFLKQEYKDLRDRVIELEKKVK